MHLRPIDPERDYPAIAALINKDVIEPYTVELKLLAIRYARASGARSMRTHNDSFNAPMLAINRKLGYQPLSGKYVLRKRLER